jgi:hypothetical protein
MRPCSLPVLEHQTAKEITSVHRALPILADADGRVVDLHPVVFDRDSNG